MILVVGLVAGFVVGILKGGSLRELANVRVRVGWLAVFALFLQILVVYWFSEEKVSPWGANAVTMMVSYLLLLIAIAVNLKLRGMRLMLAGLLLNFVVMAANGGFMPVTPEALAQANFSNLARTGESGTKLKSSKDILLSKEETRLWLFSDIFAIPPELPLRNIFSLGDVFLTIGSFAFIVSSLSRNKPLNSQNI